MKFKSLLLLAAPLLASQAALASQTWQFSCDTTIRQNADYSWVYRLTGYATAADSYSAPVINNPDALRLEVIQYVSGREPRIMLKDSLLSEVGVNLFRANGTSHDLIVEAIPFQVMHERTTVPYGGAIQIHHQISGDAYIDSRVLGTSTVDACVLQPRY